MPNLAIHIKTRDGNMLPSGIVLTYYDTDDIGTIRRTLNHRGVNHQWLAKRLCTEDEKRIEDHPTRIELHVYKSWDKLIIDENRYTQDDAWFDKLVKLKEQFPQFNNQ